MQLIAEAQPTSGWFGPRWDPFQVHVEVGFSMAFEGALSLQLLGTEAKSDEFTVTVGTDGWEATGAGMSGIGGCSPGEYFAEYFDNTHLAGEPAATACEKNTPDYGWNGGGGGPALLPGVVDQFSARWSTRIFANVGNYKFTVLSDDGNRIYFIPDGVSITGAERDAYRMTNNWGTCCRTFVDYGVILESSYRTVVMEMQEGGGGAYAHFDWEYTGGSVDLSGLEESGLEPEPARTYSYIKNIPAYDIDGSMTSLGALRAIRLHNPSDYTCIDSINVTIRGRRYEFEKPFRCIHDDEELDVATVQHVSDLHTAGSFLTEAGPYAMVAGEVRLGLGRVVALHHRSSTSHQIH
jgi:hypothetical protein